MYRLEKGIDGDADRRHLEREQDANEGGTLPPAEEQEEEQETNDASAGAAPPAARQPEIVLGSGWMFPI